MARHYMQASDVWPQLNIERLGKFNALESTVHPSYVVCLASLIQFVNLCSSAFRVAPTCVWLLRRHMRSGTLDQLTPTDANVFVDSYFSGEYKYNSVQAMVAPTSTSLCPASEDQNRT